MLGCHALHDSHATRFRLSPFNIYLSTYLSVHCYQVYFRIGAEGRQPEAPLRVGGLRDNFAGLASVTAAGA